jgi:hypothetical protein
MVQADALLMDLKAATTLPKWQENTVLGLGEQLPDTMAAFASAIEVGQVLRRGQWQSWVLTDRDVDVVFSVSNGELVLTGEPFYYFWRFGRAHDALVQSLETTQTRFNTNVDAYNALVPRVNMARSEAQQRPLLARLKELEKSLRTDSLALARLDETLDADVEGVTTLTTALRAKTAALARVNPAVYSAARRTLRYSAFFRYVKGSNPGNWQEFMTAMESVHPQPIVSTPTQFPKHSRARVH